MRMLAGARTALQTKRASRSQLSQVGTGAVLADDGKRFSAGSSYGSREGGGGFGGRRDQKDSNRRRFGIFFLDFARFPRFLKRPFRSRGATCFEKTRPSFCLFFFSILLEGRLAS